MVVSRSKKPARAALSAPLGVTANRRLAGERHVLFEAPLPWLAGFGGVVDAEADVGQDIETLIRLHRRGISRNYAPVALG